jgi:hypothetical protein
LSLAEDVVSFTPQLLYLQGKISWYPLDRRLGRPWSQFGCGGEEIEIPSLPLQGIENQSVIQPIA